MRQTCRARYDKMGNLSMLRAMCIVALDANAMDDLAADADDAEGVAGGGASSKYVSQDNVDLVKHQRM